MDPTDISNRSDPSTVTDTLPENLMVTKPSNASAADTIMAYDEVSLPQRPVPITNRSDPSTVTDTPPENTTVTKPSDTSAADTIMAHDEVALPPRPAPMTTRNTEHRSYNPTVFHFSTLPAHTQIPITRLRSSICHFWGLASPASAFPPQYLPDPDSHNWGFALMDSLNELAQLSRTAYMSQAVSYVIFHMKQRNGEFGHGYGHLHDGDVTAAMVMRGDFVIRVADVEYASSNLERIMQHEEAAEEEGYQPVGRGRGWKDAGGHGGYKKQRRGYNHY